MGRGDSKSIGQAIQDMLKSFHLTSRFDETRLINSWETIVGKPVARLTRKVYIRDKVLYVQLDSPAIRNDFLFNKAHLLEVFRKEFGEGIIKEIVLL